MTISAVEAPSFMSVRAYYERPAPENPSVPEAFDYWAPLVFLAVSSKKRADLMQALMETDQPADVRTILPTYRRIAHIPEQTVYGQVYTALSSTLFYLPHMTHLVERDRSDSMHAYSLNSTGRELLTESPL